MANKEPVAYFNQLRLLICHILAGHRCHRHRRRRLRWPCQNRPQWRRSCNSSGSYALFIQIDSVRAKVRPYSRYGLTLARRNAIVGSRRPSPFRRPTRGWRYAKHTNIRTSSCSPEHTEAGKCLSMFIRPLWRPIAAAQKWSNIRPIVRRTLRTLYGVIAEILPDKSSPLSPSPLRDMESSYFWFCYFRFISSSGFFV